ncbi:protein AATF-like isoform X2 [Tribolium madens]|uniref:protein AATF-like isoform X2 n=1 Tax=Tribolium madens TaxID=41895 RepID=UPI001CF7291B|nr:protein AATF-like isoform X2 [Tribolium madens]
MKNRSTGTLADKIAGILNTAPSSIDPEDEVGDGTIAKVVEDVEENEEEEEILSKFRRKNIDLLADLDEKYAGKKTSRKHLRDSDLEGSFDNEDRESGRTNSENEEEESAHENSEDSESNEGFSEDGEVLSENDNTEGNFKHISDTNVSNQIKKGLCVRNQMAMWENLLEVRIQLQKCLLTANKMPQHAKFREIKQSADPDFSNKVNDTKSKICGVLDKLLLLQKLLYKQYPETKELVKKSNQREKVEDPNDEEIPSDTDVEESESDEKSESHTPKKKRKLELYESEIAEKHKKYKDYRNNVIQKWNDKTRVVIKGGTTPHSVLDQIEYNLSNKDKLIKKTQLKRSLYSVLGEEETDDTTNEENSEIFDDDDFYHQLLRELIEVKSADVSDPVQLSRQWIQLQNLRSKMKRKIDTRATKGRKIRYAVHSKLVNFMAPIDENVWTDEAKNELYSSLFGKN